MFVMLTKYKWPVIWFQFPQSAYKANDSALGQTLFFHACYFLRLERIWIWKPLLSEIKSEKKWEVQKNGWHILRAFICFFNLVLIGGYLLCNVILVSAVHQHGSVLSIHISHPPPFELPTLLGHHRATSWAPCVIKQLPTGYLFYTW